MKKEINKKKFDKNRECSFYNQFFIIFQKIRIF